MSLKIMAQVLEHSRSRGTDRLILMILADHADDERWECWPSQQRLAHKANMTTRNVKRCIDELVKLGEVEVIRRGDGKTSTLYRIRADRLVTPDESVTPDKSDRADESVTGGADESVTGGLTNLSPEPSKNHQGNHQALAPSAFESDFAQLWATYPKKDDKSKALRAYQATRRGRSGRAPASAEDLATATAAYLKAKRDTDPRYLKLLATFLGPDEPWREYLGPAAPAERRECFTCHASPPPRDGCRVFADCPRLPEEGPFENE